MSCGRQSFSRRRIAKANRQVVAAFLQRFNFDARKQYTCERHLVAHQIWQDTAWQQHGSLNRMLNTHTTRAHTNHTQKTGIAEIYATASIRATIPKRVRHNHVMTMFLV